MNRFFVGACAAALTAALAVPVSTLAQPAGVPGFAVRMIDLPGGVDNQVQANNILNNGYASIMAGVSGYGADYIDVTRIVPAIDFPGNTAGDIDETFGINLPFLGYGRGGQAGAGSIHFNADHLVGQFSANVSIPAGRYQIGVGSDDGFTVTIPGVTFMNTENTNGMPSDVGKGADTFIYNAGRGVDWTLATFTVPAGGLNTTMSGTWHEGTGGAGIEIAIRNANTFEVIRLADMGPFGDINPTLDGWVPVQDGALGWQVRTDASENTYINARGNANKIFLRPELINQELSAPTDLVGSVAFRIYDNAQHNGNGNWDSYVDLIQSPNINPPTYSGVMAAPVRYGNPDYPDEWQAFFPDAASGNGQEQYSMIYGGEMFIPKSAEFTEFKDGNDDFTLLRIDLDGNGIFTKDETIINDNNWTNLATTGNNGSPVAMANFANIPAAGAWRKFEMVMGEGTGGDSTALYWSGGPAGFLPAQAQSTGPEYAVPAENFRVAGHQTLMSADVGFSFAGQLVVFDVDMEELEWDKIAFDPRPSNNELLPVGSAGATISAGQILSFEGGTIRVELTDNPYPGMVIDLVDNLNISQIIGPDSFEFTHGDENLWDTTQFTVNGQLTFGGAAEVLLGDYNGDGRVAQEDLDFVLLTWGQPFDTISDDWVSQRPTDGIIDQVELDPVLLHWGETLGALGGAAGVPEPSTVALLLVAAGLGLGLRWRKK